MALNQHKHLKHMHTEFKTPKFIKFNEVFQYTCFRFSHANILSDQYSPELISHKNVCIVIYITNRHNLPSI